MKRVLIISPYFPPVNGADMQRVRMSLPYFNDLGWDAEVVTVAPEYADLPKDELLLKSVPSHIKIHTVKALSKKLTSKFGLGSLALRSLWFFKQKVNELLQHGSFDLIYFSTTQFPVCVLGNYWKKRFGVPYIIDMQDPWHSEYYRDKPKSQRPKKYWFSYRLNKYLEPIAMKRVGGLISVSESYITDLQNLYPHLKNVPAATITFGAFAPDNEIANANADKFPPLLDTQTKNLVYVGRGGADMQNAITPVFAALAQILKIQPDAKLKLYFIGTSYAPAGLGKPTIMPLATQMGLQNHVVEITDRISYYNTLTTLQQADALFIPGSDDPKYTASKIYPYLLSNKPVLGVIHSKSPARQVLTEYGVEHVYCFDEDGAIENNISAFLYSLLNNAIPPAQYNLDAVKKYAALNMAKRQCQLFQLAINE